MQSGHVVRLNLDEIWRLEERMANLQQVRLRVRARFRVRVRPGGLHSAWPIFSGLGSGLGVGLDLEALTVTVSRVVFVTPQEQAKCERAAMYPQMPGGLASAAVAPTGAPARREWATREKHSSTQSPGGEPQMP